MNDLIGKIASFYIQRTKLVEGTWIHSEEWIFTGVIRGIEADGVWFVEVRAAARSKPGDLLRFKTIAKEGVVRISLTDHPEAAAPRRYTATGDNLMACERCGNPERNHVESDHVYVPAQPLVPRSL